MSSWQTETFSFDTWNRAVFCCLPPCHKFTARQLVFDNLINTNLLKNTHHVSITEILIVLKQDFDTGPLYKTSILDQKRAGATLGPL